MSVRTVRPLRERPPVADAPPEIAARYRALFEIGRGGMGTIEVALERDAAGGWTRVVALKRMHPHTRDRRHVEMFFREARLAAWLVHPNVVHAFDFGETEGELFLALEYVEGETLAAIVERARERGTALSPVLVASIVAAACEGLHAAHELRDPASGAPLNVIHRDVSPHNVMVSYEGHVKLLDFGVAKMDSVDPLTRTGEVKGKTAYMSPEQAMGDPVDRRSDLFAVGAVLFECLAGQRMWGAGTDVETMRKLALESPPRLETAVPHAPRALSDLVARLVARAPADRPSTAMHVARELRAFAAQASAHAVDAPAIASLMTSLFGDEATERRRLLNDAISATAPAVRVDVLRRSLAGPTALAAITPASSPLVSPDASDVLATSAAARGAARAPIAAPATRRGVVASMLGGLLLAAAIAAAGVARRAPSDAPPAPSSSSALASSSTPPTVASPSSTPSSAAPPIAPSASASASAPARAPLPPSTSVKRSGPSRRAPAPSGQVDVDPNPL